MSRMILACWESKHKESIYVFFGPGFQATCITAQYWTCCGIDIIIDSSHKWYWQYGIPSQLFYYKQSICWWWASEHLPLTMMELAQLPRRGMNNPPSQKEREKKKKKKKNIRVSTVVFFFVLHLAKTLAVEQLFWWWNSSLLMGEEALECCLHIH